MTALPLVQDKVTDVVTTHSAILGPISIPADQCISFEHGLLGFPRAQRFAMLPAAPDGVFWLQGVDDGSLVFLVADPHRFVEGYSFDPLSIEGPKPILDEEAECAVLCIVTLPHRAGEAVTANLQGPVLVDFSTRRGWQLVVAAPGHGTRHPIDISLPNDGEISSSDQKNR